jgi:uncharacterized protein (TIGR02001 family)
MSPLHAQTADVGGTIGVTNDYVYRGISQTSGNPALQADLHYRTPKGWIFGAWGSHADLRDGEGPQSEVDIYLGRSWTLNADWDARVTLTHYMYPGDSRQLKYDYDEVVTTLGYRSRLFATVAWSPNVTRYANGPWVDDATALSYELAASQPLFSRLSALAGVGYYDLPSKLDADYWFWNAGVSCTVGHAQLIVSYIDTDSNASRAFGYQTTGGRWAGTVAWRF